MKSDSIAFGVSGIVFGLLAGWIIGNQSAKVHPIVETPAATQAPAASGAPSAAILDPNQVQALTSVAEREPSNPTPRIQLANVYFDAQHFDDAAKWYVEALKLSPKDPDVSTDLGLCYYYLNQPDKALAQFDVSLKMNPKHVKTLLNIGVVRALGKQDLQGAQAAWEQVLQLAPDSPEGQQAKRALDSVRSAHPGTGPPSGS
jgi:cytochrome c-type biogenesis protein CcmH/NrfG